MRFLGVVIAGLIVGSVAANAAEETPELAALAALNEFIDAWNTADNAELRKALNYPFFTLFRPGRLEIAETPEQFTTDFQLMREQQNWARSTFDESKALTVTEDQVHFATTYSRHNTDGEKYQTGRVLYIVTKQDGHWGIQLRSGLPSREADAEAETAARGVVDAFFTAWNGADNEAMAKTINFPHAFIIRDGRAAIAKSAIRIGTDFEGMRESEGWHHSEYNSLEFIHAAPDKVIAQLTFTRHHDDGTIYRTVPVLWIITNQDGHWGIQLRAILGAL